MGKLIDLTGQRFGRLLVNGRNEGVPAKWKCVCDCGNVRVVPGQVLREGLYVSCGCYRAETRVSAVTTHGCSKTPTYRVWATMRQRCHYPSASSYPNYGGRGITVCERWRSFENFLADMGHAPKGRSIERRDNNAGYSPENCYWATRKEQSSNMRSNLYLTIGTLTQHVAQWAREAHINEATIRQRLYAGWEVEAAVLLPSVYTWNLTRKES